MKKILKWKVEAEDHDVNANVEEIDAERDDVYAKRGKVDVEHNDM